VPASTRTADTESCWAALAQASKHARYLDLIDPDALIDRRNPKPLLYWNGHTFFRSTADVSVVGGDLWELQSISKPDFPLLPALSLFSPSSRHPVMVEVWVEK
jgi:hypothetical protein